MKFTKRKLASGLRAIVAPMESTSTVTVLVLIGTGSNYETREINGLSHFLEHMFFKGTKNHPKPLELDTKLDAVGAEHNAFTDREETGYWIKTDTKHFDLAMHFVSDILQNALIKEEEINRERGVILQEMNMVWDDPRRFVWSVFERLVYGDNSYGWDIIGTQKNIQTIKRTAFMNYWKSQYVASNTVVIVAGNVSEERVFKKIETSFQDLRRGAFKKAAKFTEPAMGPRVALESKNTEQSHVVVGTTSFPLDHKDRLIADVLAAILGGYMSSRLFLDIRERHGLAYAVRAFNQAYRDTGFFAAYAGVPHAKRKEVVEKIVANFAKVRKMGVTSEELTRAKENIKGKLALSLESTDEVASFLGVQENLLGKIKLPADVIRRLDKITKEDVHRVAKSLFRPEKMYSAIIGPDLKEEAYEAILHKV